MDQADIEYTKSRYRCPICGKLVGCSETGKVGIFGLKAFSRHVRNCRHTSRVKPTKPGERNAD